MHQVLHSELLLVLAGNVQNDAPFVHHDQAVAVGNGVAHIVGDHQRGQMVLADDPVRGLQHLGGGLGVQGGGVLVQQQQLRLLHGGHEQRQRLALAAGKQADLGCEPRFQPQAQGLEQRAVFLPLGLFDAGHQCAPFAAALGQGQVFLDAHGGGGAHHRVLEHAADERGALVFGQAGHVGAVDDDGALVHGPGAGDGVHQGALAGAVAADDGDEVPVLHGEIHAVQGALFVHRAGVESLIDPFDLKHASHLLS